MFLPHPGNGKIPTEFCLKLISNLADLRQKMRPETIKVCNPHSCFQQHSIVWLTKFITRANLLSRAVFHFVTERAKTVAVHSKSGVPIPAKDRHFNANPAQAGVSSPVLSNFSGEQLMIIHAGRFRQL